MEFANQPQRNGKPLAEAAYSMLERRHVVGNLLHIIDGNSRRFVVLEQEKIGERGLSALYLRGKDRFLANVAIEQL